MRVLGSVGHLRNLKEFWGAEEAMFQVEVEIVGERNDLGAGSRISVAEEVLTLQLWYAAGGIVVHQLS